MKNILFFLILLLVASSNSIASINDENNKPLSGIPQVKNITIDLGDITNLTEGELSQAIKVQLDASLSTLPVALQCSVTLKAKVSVYWAEFEVSVTVSGDCAEIATAGTAIANQIIAQIRSYLETM